MTSSAPALGDVLAAASDSGDGFTPPGIGEFFPKVLVDFSVLGVEFEITQGPKGLQAENVRAI